MRANGPHKSVWTRRVTPARPPPGPGRRAVVDDGAIRNALLRHQLRLHGLAESAAAEILAGARSAVPEARLRG